MVSFREDKLHSISSRRFIDDSKMSNRIMIGSLKLFKFLENLSRLLTVFKAKKSSICAINKNCQDANKGRRVIFIELEMKKMKIQEIFCMIRI